MSRKIFITAIALLLAAQAHTQNKGLFSGSFSSASHYYQTDRSILFIRPNDPFASNNILRLNYSQGSIVAGLQYEAYLPPISGFPYQLEGDKIVYRFFRYTKNSIDITVGNFYEQFGNGLILRAYENRDLGINNSLDGFRIIYRPLSFLRITGVYGKPRRFLENSANYVRGVDADIVVDTVFNSSASLRFGAGVVSKFDRYTGPLTDFPEMVTATSVRASLSSGSLDVNGEYVVKSADPSEFNDYSHTKGSSLLLNGNFTKNRFGLFFSLRFLKQMNFLNERESNDIYNTINYLPSNTRQHSYMLTNIYPYSTQTGEEFSLQGEVNYTFEKGSAAGGKYGTSVRVNFSQVRDLKATGNSNEVSLISAGDKLYFQDLNIEISKKWSNTLKSVLTYANIQYDKGSLEAPVYDFVRSNIVVADISYKASRKLSLRGEAQHLWTKEDEGNWIAGLVEIGFAPYLNLYASNMVNYRYSNKANYYNVGLGYKNNYVRLSLGYGRQREGLMCAGGICLKVPSYKGFNLKLDVNF